MPNGKPHPAHWVCDTCGLRFLMDLTPDIMCATHGEGDHCHAGHRILCDDGSVQWAVASPQCITFATSGSE